MRHRNPVRCEVCGFRVAACLCEQLPRVALPWPMTVIQHRVERRKPTNTGRVLARVVEGARILVQGLEGPPLAAAAIADPDRRPLVLFPGPSAVTVDRKSLRRWADEARPLVVLDGTWRQAARMIRRIDGVSKWPCAALPLDVRSHWPIRTATRPERLCTFEAVVQWTELAGHDAAPTLRAAFTLLRDAQLAVRPPRHAAPDAPADPTG